MPTTTFVAGNLQWLGIAKETTYGTAPAGPTYWIPVDSPKWDPKITALVDTALRGDMGTQYGQAQGMRYDEVTYKTYLYPDTCFPHFLAALGTADAGGTTLATPATPTASTATTGGTLAAGTYYYKYTATATNSESAASAEVSQTTTGSTSVNTITGTAVTGATGYNWYRSTATGAEVFLTSTATPSLTDNGSYTPGTKAAPAAAAYTHKTSLLNTAQTGQPPSFTIWLFEGDKCVQIPGAVIADVKATVKANELPTLDVSWQGMVGTFVTAPANTPSSVAPMPPFTASATVGGTQLNKYTGFTIDLKRGTKPIPALNGTQSPLAIYCGELTVTGTLDAVYQNTTDNDLGNLLANTQPAVSLSITPQGSANALVFQMSKVAYDASTPQGSNSGWMTLSSTYKALMNATDALDSKLSPIQIQLTNTQATAY